MLSASRCWSVRGLRLFWVSISTQPYGILHYYLCLVDRLVHSSSGGKEPGFRPVNSSAGILFFSPVLSEDSHYIKGFFKDLVRPSGWNFLCENQTDLSPPSDSSIHRFMERSRRILHKIASISHRVVTAADEYADREDLDGVPRCHFQLEEAMRRISVACQCLAGNLGKTSPEGGPSVDVRLQDWLDTDEPQKCLDTLGRMERLLQKDASWWMSGIFRRGRGTTTTQDKIKEAVHIFSTCEVYFHFLFSTEIW